MEINTTMLNKGWFLVLTPYSALKTSWKQDFVIDAAVEGTNEGANGVWTQVGPANQSTTHSEILCFDDYYERGCVSFILLSQDESRFRILSQPPLTHTRMQHSQIRIASLDRSFVARALPSQC
jgi:hypothetical protein